MMNRKRFLQKGMLVAGAALLSPKLLEAANKHTIFTAEEINEFVSAAHSDFDKTKKIIDQKPLILNCASQIAKGDFETAVGGSSHMGRKDITDLLVERGARLDIFNLTFLGFSGYVKKMIEYNPQYLNAYGPHGFTLLHHANVGNHNDLASWLQDQGLNTDMFMDIFQE